MAEQDKPSAPAGWYSDPEGSGMLRWFDGEQWTEHRHDAPAPKKSGLTSEVEALHVIIILLIAAALIFGAIQWSKSQDDRVDRATAPLNLGPAQTP